MSELLEFWNRLRRSAVVWSWAFNFLRLSAGIVLLPLLLKKLSDDDLGMYYVFVRLMALVPIIDFGFSTSIGRSVSYAMGGAQTLLAQGVQAEPSGQGPNWNLLWQLLDASRRLYALMAVAALLLLGCWGTWNVALTVSQTDDPKLTWMAWVLTLSAAAYQLYSGWWNTYLRGANAVVPAARYAVFGYAVQLTIACGLLFGGAGLLSVPVGMLAGSFTQQLLSRRGCLKLFPEHQEFPRTRGGELLRILWPNSWRVGLQLLSGYLGVSLPALLFASQFGLAMFAPYGISLQVLTICSGMAIVWVHVKWPQVGQYRARQDLAALRRLLWPRIWLQNITYIALALAAIFVGPLLLEWIGSGKELLPANLLGLMALVVFLDLQFTFWTTLISTENRIPSLWPTVATQLMTLVLYLVLSHLFALTYLALILAPLLAGGLFNYWYWMFHGSRGVGTTLLKFALRKE